MSASQFRRLDDAVQEAWAAYQHASSVRGAALRAVAFAAGWYLDMLDDGRRPGVVAEQLELLRRRRAELQAAEAAYDAAWNLWDARRRASRYVVAVGPADERYLVEVAS